MKKDTLVSCDLLNAKGKMQRTRKLRLVGGKCIPGTRVTLRRDTLGAQNLTYFLRAVCLRTGTLLIEPITRS